MGIPIFSVRLHEHATEVDPKIDSSKLNWNCPRIQKTSDLPYQFRYDVRVQGELFTFRGSLFAQNAPRGGFKGEWERR